MDARTQQAAPKRAHNPLQGLWGKRPGCHGRRPGRFSLPISDPFDPPSPSRIVLPGQSVDLEDLSTECAQAQRGVLDDHFLGCRAGYIEFRPYEER